MSDRATTALREQLADAVERRLEDRRRLDEIAAMRDQLAGRVAALEDEIGRLRSAVAEAVEAPRAQPVAAEVLVVPDAPPPGVAPAAASPASQPADVAPEAAAPAPAGVAPEAAAPAPVDVRREADASEQAAPGAAPAPAPVAASPRRRVRASLPGVLFAAGALAVADCAVTLAWQEPISAVYGSYQQGRLDDELQRLDTTMAAADVALSAREEARLRRVSARQEAEGRMRRLAARLERRLRPGEPLARMRIERLGESLVVVEGTGASALRRGPGRYSTGSLPGQDGTFGIAGHRTSWSAPFRRIDRLRRGDRIVVTMPYGRFTYAVTTKRIVDPEDVWVLRARTRERLVLTACHPLFSARQRIVVSAELVRATPRGAALRRA